MAIRLTLRYLIARQTSRYLDIGKIEKISVQRYNVRKNSKQKNGGAIDTESTAV